MGKARQVVEGLTGHGPVLSSAYDEERLTPRQRRNLEALRDRVAMARFGDFYDELNDQKQVKVDEVLNGVDIDLDATASKPEIVSHATMGRGGRNARRRN